MANLTAEDRKELWADWMRDLSRKNEPVADISKADMRGAINAFDDWIESNQGTLNAVIPVGARAQLTTKQKAQLFVIVLTKRFEVI